MEGRILGHWPAPTSCFLSQPMHLYNKLVSLLNNLWTHNQPRYRGCAANALYAAGGSLFS